MIPQKANELADSVQHLMPNILALDQSSHTTGYSVFENDKPIKIGHFDCRGTDLGPRLVQFREEIIKLINEYDIGQVVFENIQLQNNVPNNVKTYKALAEIIGVLQELLEEQKIPYEIVEPTVWKATFKIAGKGREREKKLAQDYILNTYGVKCSEDEADSACIGTHYITKKNSEYDWSF